MTELFTSAGMAEFMTAHSYEWATTCGAVGACMASFVGVVVGRLPHSAGWRPTPKPGVNLMQPSCCDTCGVKIPALALVPVLGWLANKGKCASCGAAVPSIYPASEVVIGAACAGLAVFFGPTEQALWSMAILWALLAISWIDLREAWIPSRITAPLLVLGLIASPFEPDALSRNMGLALCGGALFASGAWVSWRKGGVLAIGGGDLELAAAAGAWLGKPLAPAFLLIACALQMVTHIAARFAPGGRWEPADPEIRTAIGDFDYAPMGPAISIAFFVCLLAGRHFAIG